MSGERFSLLVQWKCYAPGYLVLLAAERTAAPLGTPAGARLGEGCDFFFAGLSLRRMTFFAAQENTRLSRGWLGPCSAQNQAMPQTRQVPVEEEKRLPLHSSVLL